MKLLSWNILHGGGSRVNDIVDNIYRYDCDVVCLQEFRHGKSKIALEEGIKKAGLVHAFCPTASKATTNCVAVFSKQSCSGNTLYTDSKGAIRCTEVVLDSLAVRVICVSFPHKKEQIPLFELLLDLDSSYIESKTVIVGDFNCGIPFEDSETKTFYATHLFQQLLKQGWKDSWRSRNTAAREFTWFSTQKGNGFRYDHVLSSPTFDKHVTSVEYDHTVRKQRISDHSSLLLQC